MTRSRRFGRRQRDQRGHEPVREHEPAVEAVGPFGKVEARVRATRLAARPRGRDQRAADGEQVRVLDPGRAASRRARPRPRARLPSSRSTPASRVKTLLELARARRDRRRAGGTTSPGDQLSTPRSAPDCSGASLPAAIASTMREPNTRPSSSEFDASRLAPCTPLHAASPHAQSPGRLLAPSRSATTPPER